MHQGWDPGILLPGTVSFHTYVPRRMLRDVHGSVVYNGRRLETAAVSL